MTSPLPANLVPDIGARLVNGLAVVGGAVVGWVLAGVLVQLLVRLIARRPAPPVALRLVRLLGGIAAGLAVYLLVFGTGGGWGLGGPGGWIFGGRGSQGNGTGLTTGPTGKDRPPPGTPPTTGKAPTPAPADTLRVEIIPANLAAERKDRRFYRVQGETTYCTLTEMAELIEARRAKGIKVVEIITYRNSVAERVGLVDELRNRIQQPGLTVKSYELPTDAP
jgi:hypothetical protein